MLRMAYGTQHIHTIPEWITICKLLRYLVFLCGLNSTCLAQNYDLISGATTYYHPRVVFEFLDPITGSVHNITLQEKQARSNANFAGNAKGLLRSHPNQGCSEYPKYARKENWVAFLKRTGGRCKESEKVKRAQAANASAVILYTSDKDELDDVEIGKDVKRITVVLIKGIDTAKILRLLENGTKITVEIEEGNKIVETIKVQRSSVLFVSVSFIVLMIISLAWLVFYYIQRFRYAQARDRTQRRLSKAAKKALMKLPVKSVKEEDTETKGNICSVCLELYRLGETIRVLPCSHFYHKNCVDQWLIDHRTCPMCKSNILKALGYQTLPPQLSEEALYALELSQLMFGSGLDDDTPMDIDFRSNEVETVRIPLANQITLPRGNIVQIVMVPTPDSSESHENDFQDAEATSGRSGGSVDSSRPATTTTVEMHGEQQQGTEPSEQNPLIPHTSV